MVLRRGLARTRVRQPRLCGVALLSRCGGGRDRLVAPADPLSVSGVQRDGGAVALPLRLLPAGRGDSSRTRDPGPASPRPSVPHGRRDPSRQAGHPLPRAALRDGRRTPLIPLHQLPPHCSGGTTLDVTTSAEVHEDPLKPFHFSLLDADKLNPNRQFHNKPNHCDINFKQRPTVTLIDPETQNLAVGNRGVSLHRTAFSRQVDHGSLTRHLPAGKGQLEPHRNPYILTTAVVVDEAAPPPLKGEKSVRTELAAEGRDAEEAPKSLDHALSWRLLN